ncbi:MAG TPA: GDP-mannose 4,6-dehydratase [Thermoleophilaceae bacterium]
MRVLITGAAGFAGGHLAAHLVEAGHDVVGAGRAPEAPIAFDYVTLELRDADAVRSAFAQVAPDWVAHLAADASVSESWEDPRGTLHNNLDSTLNVLDAAGAATVLVAGSGEVYGPPARLPVDETHELRPQNPYAVSKAAADVLAGFFADAHGRRVIRTRAFNHFGPGQSDLYVVAAFARQIAEAERVGNGRVVVRTGNLEARRDFTDVRDVVSAYALLMERAEPGAYNICSGSSRSAGDILAALARESPLEVAQETDPARLRTNEVMEIRGSHQKLSEATGWQPVVPFEQTIRDTLDWWRSR